jgi:hypothetical protein
MVAMAYCYSAFSSAAMGVPSISILPMAQDLGWSIAELSAPQGARMVVFDVVTPFAGGLILRFGLRKTFAISGVLLIAGLFLSINMTQKWNLWLGKGFFWALYPVWLRCRYRQWLRPEGLLKDVELLSTFWVALSLLERWSSYLWQLGLLRIGAREQGFWCPNCSCDKLGHIYALWRDWGTTTAKTADQKFCFN